MACMNFIILKVNGIDVSNFPHEEAVKIFLNAPEPILVEVKRRNSTSTGNGSEINNFEATEAPSSSSQSSGTTHNTRALQDKRSGCSLSPQKENKFLQTVASQTNDDWLMFGTNKFREKPTASCEYSNLVNDDDAVEDQQEEQIEVEIENEFDEDDDDEEGLSQDIDIEEITLRKSNSGERLGLTVSYSINVSSGNAVGSSSEDTETCTEVFITDINLESVAGIDGRLKRGDQILQVNGRDVTNREETELLFAENKNAVTLLVSRCIQFTNDNQAEQSDVLDDSQSNLYFVHQDFSHSEKSNENAIEQKQQLEYYQKSESKTMISSLKDPLHHTNIRAHIELVNQELAALDSRMESALNLNGNKSSNGSGSNRDSGSATGGEVEQIFNYRPPTDSKFLSKSQLDSTLTTKKRKPPTIPHIPAPPLESDTEHIYETIPEDIELEPLYCSPYESAGTSNIVEQWLKYNNQGGTATAGNRKNRRNCENSGTVKKCNSSGEDHENSSSAYNTGGSCNSNQHLTLNLLSPSADRDTRRSTLVLCPPEVANSSHKQKSYQTLPADNQANEACTKCCRHKKDKSSPKHQKVPGATAPPSPNSPNSKMPKAANQLNNINSNSLGLIQPLASATSNKFALHQTMQLQQQIFRQAFMQSSNSGLNSGTNTLVAHPVGTGISNSFKNFTAPSLSQYQFVSGCNNIAHPPPQQVYRTSLQPRTNEENMEWKVKRRQDGTRYIVRVRRPIRSRLLKDRARLLTEERSAEITTEDDTISEVKLGKYWTKEERKKHLEKARDTRRNRQETICASKNQQLIEENRQNDGFHLRGVTTVPSCSRSNHPNRLSNPLPSSVSTVSAGIPSSGKKTLKKKHEENLPATVQPGTENGGDCPGILSITTV